MRCMRSGRGHAAAGVVRFAQQSILSWRRKQRRIAVAGITTAAFESVLVRVAQRAVGACHRQAAFMKRSFERGTYRIKRLRLGMADLADSINRACRIHEGINAGVVEELYVS